MRKKSKFLSYEEAKVKVRKLYPGITKKAQWFKIIQEDSFPEDIPTNPSQAYRIQKIWISWGVWLGTNKTRKKPKSKFVTYKEAIRLLKPYNIQTKEEFQKFKATKEFPLNTPKSPANVYAGNGWIDWPTYLSRGLESHLSEARYKKNLKASKELIKDYGGRLLKVEGTNLTIQCRYNHTELTFQMSKFLSRKSWCRECYSSVGEEVTRQVFNYVTGQNFKKVRKELPFLKYGNSYLELDGYNENLKMAFEFQSSFHNNPESQKRDKLKSDLCEQHGIELITVDFFDRTSDLIKIAEELYRTISAKVHCVRDVSEFKPNLAKALSKLLTYNKAKSYIKNNHSNITSLKKYKEWTKVDSFPSELPVSPHKFYKNIGWQGWGDYLSTGNVSNTKKVFVSYEKASEYGKIKKIKSSSHWRKMASMRPKNIPAEPHVYYKGSGWESWNKFLGVENNNNHNRDFLTFEEARNFVRDLGINSVNKYKQAHRSGILTDLLPVNPDRAYEEFEDWYHFFFHEKPDFLTYNEARMFLLSLGVTNSNKWKIYCRAGHKPDFLPRNIERFYKKQWKGWRFFAEK